MQAASGSSLCRSDLRQDARNPRHHSVDPQTLDRFGDHVKEHAPEGDVDWRNQSGQAPPFVGVPLRNTTRLWGHGLLPSWLAARGPLRIESRSLIGAARTIALGAQQKPGLAPRSFRFASLSRPPPHNGSGLAEPRSTELAPARQVRALHYDWIRAASASAIMVGL